MSIFLDGWRIVNTIFQIAGVLALALIGLVVIIGGTILILRKFVMEAIAWCERVDAESTIQSRELAVEKEKSRVWYDEETGQIEARVRAMAEQLADKMVEERVGKELQERWDNLRRAQNMIDPSAKYVVVEFQGVRAGVPYMRQERLKVGKGEKSVRIAQLHADLTPAGRRLG